MVQLTGLIGSDAVADDPLRKAQDIGRPGIGGMFSLPGKKWVQTAICGPCGNEKILALGLCAPCYDSEGRKYGDQVFIA